MYKTKRDQYVSKRLSFQLVFSPHWFFLKTEFYYVIFFSFVSVKCFCACQLLVHNHFNPLWILICIIQPLWTYCLLFLHICWIFLDLSKVSGGGDTHILRHTGISTKMGRLLFLFCKKSLDMGTIFHWKTRRQGSTFSIKAPGHGWPIWLMFVYKSLCRLYCIDTKNRYKINKLCEIIAFVETSAP